MCSVFAALYAGITTTTFGRFRGMRLGSARQHDKLIAEEPFPNPRRFKRQPLQHSDGGRSLPPGQRKTDRDTRAHHPFDAKAAAIQQLDPAIPGIEMQVRTVEQTKIVLRETAP